MRQDGGFVYDGSRADDDEGEYDEVNVCISPSDLEYRYSCIESSSSSSSFLPACIIRLALHAYLAPVSLKTHMHP